MPWHPGNMCDMLAIKVLAGVTGFSRFLANVCESAYIHIYIHTSGPCRFRKATYEHVYAYIYIYICVCMCAFIQMNSDV